MNPSDSTQSRPHDDAWNLELALQVWGSDGGQIPDTDQAEPSVPPAEIKPTTPQPRRR
jgi:hypothetical protein